MLRHLLLVVFIAHGACAPVLPHGQPDRALVRDVERIVDVRGRVGWLVDESEILAALPDTMKSVCQVPPQARRAALDWLDEKIDEHGGDIDLVWRERGKNLGKVDKLLLLTRTRVLLSRANEWARLGRCPFWLEPTMQFRGVHAQGWRFFATIEGGGRFTEEFALGTVRYGGGGAGRLLAGYSFGENWALSTGLEFGGTARFTNLQLGEQSELPELVGLGAAPVVFRWQFGLTAHMELEAGPIAYIDEATADQVMREVKVQFDWGYRVGAALGGTYVRLNRGVVPKFAVFVTVDHVPGTSGQLSLTQISIGARTGLDLSHWRNWD